MGDNYDEMSNDQLRLKLLEFGLANMPVTSTTRKVLIKKLRNHIATNGKRRETMNLTSYSSDEDSSSQQNSALKKGATSNKKDSVNRRATIATVATAKPSLKPIPPPKPVMKAPSQTLPPEPVSASKRRSGRSTPVKDSNAAALAPAQGAPKVPTILEDSDDGMIPSTRRDRKSASPSLSRADMLTTSYVHHMAVSAQPSEPIVEEMDVDDVPEMDDVIVLDDDDDDAIMQITMPPPQQPKPIASYSQTTTAAQTSTETYRTLSAGTMTDQKANEVEPPSYSSGSEFLRTATKRNTVRPETFSTSSDRKERQERNTFAEPEPVPYSSSKRPVPAFLPSPSTATTTVIRDEKKFDAPESPYLSEFTKRLARLRAEAVQQPSGLGIDSPSRRTVFEGASVRSSYTSRDIYDEPPPSASRYRPGRQTIAPMSSSSTFGGGRRIAAMQRDEMTADVRNSVRQSLLALDRKYSIRKIFYSIIIVLVVIFLFVFFFL